MIYLLTAIGLSPGGSNLIIVETARFNLLGVLLKLKARPTFIFVRDANLNALLNVPSVTSLVSMSSWCDSSEARKFSASALQTVLAIWRQRP